MSLSRTISEISPNFSLPMYLTPQMKGFSLELGTGAGVQKISDGATVPNKKFDNIFSCVHTIYQRDRQTDGHWTTAKTTNQTTNH